MNTVSTPIGQKIRNVRESLSMGRQEFADKTGINKGSLIRIEVSDGEVMSNVLVAIAAAFPEYAAYLLTDDLSVKQRHPEVDAMARELPRPKRVTK